MDVLTARFHNGERLYCRTVSAVLLADVLDIPPPPARLHADWRREITQQMDLQPGDIDTLPLGRTRLRWPQLQSCVAAVEQWLGALGVPDVLGSAEMALMGSRGTPYHHDGAQYGGAAFCNLFLSAGSAVDFHFPAAGHRLALGPGTVVVFDTCQPHALIRRGARGFAAADFAGADQVPLVFLTWELPISHAAIAQRLGIRLEGEHCAGAPDAPPGLLRNGALATLCPRTGEWT